MLINLQTIKTGANTNNICEGSQDDKDHLEFFSNESGTNIMQFLLVF